MDAGFCTAERWPGPQPTSSGLVKSTVSLQLCENWLSWWSQMVKNLPAMQKPQVLSLGQEDPMEEGMAAHSSILAWRTPWTEEPGGLHSMGSQRVGHD